MKKHIAAIVLATAGTLCQADDAGLPFNARGELQRPADFREWVFLTVASA